jgi:hypothetical protein
MCRGSRSGLRRFAGLAVIGISAAVVLGGCTTSASPKSAAHHKADGLVGYPSFLPKKTLNEATDSMLIGTVKRPALTSEGDIVKVVTPNWTAYAVVSGPVVPGEGLPYQGGSTTCTWTVKMYGATKPVPIRAADFNSIDLQGEIFYPYFVPGQPTPPKMLQPGQTVTFELRTGEAVGEGLMRWAPNNGQIVAKWDFVVEND